MADALGSDQVLKWSTNNLILDEIFKHLKWADLKNVRLTCKNLAIGGSKALVKNSVIRLSEFRPIVPGLYVLYTPQNKIRIPHWRTHLLDQRGHLLEIEEDLWETKEELRPQDYFRISAYRNYLDQMVVFPTEFQPKKVIVYNFDDLVRLPMPHFGSIEDLTVVFFKPSEGYSFLKEFHKLFPNLRCIQLENIMVETTPFSHRLHSLLNDVPEPLGKTCLRLAQLSIAVPAEFANADWRFVTRFTELKVARLRWVGAYHNRLLNCMEVQPVDMDQNYSRSDVFGQWLSATKTHLNCSSLNDLSLRFDLSAENFENIQIVLAETNLQSLSLEVHGTGEEVLLLLAGLDPKNIAALTNLHAGCFIYSKDEVKEMLELLRNKGFFTKRKWMIRFRSKFELSWLRLIMEEERFTVQMDSSMFCFDSTDLRDYLWSHHEHLFEKFTYGFCRVTANNWTNPGDCTKNQCEAINLTAFAPETLETMDGFRNQANQGHVWATRQEPEKLLCDNVDFKRESCISLWNHPNLYLGSSERIVDLSSWSFFHVPQPLISKWCSPNGDCQDQP